MARLLSPPIGIGVTSIEPLSGPRSVGASRSESGTAFVQTTASAFGLWRFRFSFHAMHRSAFRAYRGWVTALHGGANATRWHLYDPDRMTPAEVGLNVPARTWWTDSGQGETWANGEPWSNGQPWGMSAPDVQLAASVARDGTIVNLADEFWGHGLSVGDYLGFAPSYFGLHTVTEVIEPGVYRVWPPLRKALTTDDFATLDPTLAMRLESEEGATAGRGLVVAEGLTATLVEVPDYVVREYFTD